MGFPSLEFAIPVFTDPTVIGLIVIGTIVGVVVRYQNRGQILIRKFGQMV